MAFCLMSLLPQGSSPTYPLFPYTSLFLSIGQRFLSLQRLNCYADQPFPRQILRSWPPLPSVHCRLMPPKGTGRAQEFAAIDLGSNSFHLLVARRDDNELRVIDRMRDSVRLAAGRSEEHTSELQSLMRIPYAVYCLKKKNKSL